MDICMGALLDLGATPPRGTRGAFNGYRFGGAGEAAIKSGLRLGPIPPLVLAPCVFAKATNLEDANFGGPWRPASDALGDDLVPILYDRSCMEALIDFQMQRIVKYLRRGFRFPV